MKTPRPNNEQFTRLYRRFLYRVAGRMLLLLTTRGRKSGKPHTVGLQYELIDGRYYLGVADGERADWYRNLCACPEVELQVGRQQLKGHAESVSDTGRVADFLQYRLKKHPLLIRAILRSDELKGRIDRAALIKYAQGIRVVAVTPLSVS